MYYSSQFFSNFLSLCFKFCFYYTMYIYCFGNGRSSEKLLLMSFFLIEKNTGTT